MLPFTEEPPMRRRRFEPEDNDRRPARIQPAVWDRQLPVGPGRMDGVLRESIVGLYALTVGEHLPPDVAVAKGRREGKLDGVPRAETGRIIDGLLALLRRRIRTLIISAVLHENTSSDVLSRIASGDPDAIPEALPPPMSEARLALYFGLCERANLSPKTAHFRAARERDSFVDTVAKFEEWESALAAAPEFVQLAARHSMPAPVMERWIAKFGLDEATALAAALGEPAPVVIRANRHRGTREELHRLLAEEGYDSKPTGTAPDALALNERTDIISRECFRDGWFEMQDEASQLVSIALDPRPGWRVLDACAGAGGKTLHLSALMKNKGEICAHDTRAERAVELKARLRRAGADNVRVLEPKGAAGRAPYDAVLIDAPCLGLGTLRRNPDLAWRGTIATRMADVVAMQWETLRAYAPLVKPGGILVYAVCSFEPEETTELLARFEKEYPMFRPDSLERAFSFNDVQDLVTEGQSQLLLLPHRQGTDGFFLARWKRDV